MKQAIFEKVEDFRRNGRVKKKWQWKTLEEEVAVEDFRRGGILRACRISHARRLKRDVYSVDHKSRSVKREV